MSIFDNGGNLTRDGRGPRADACAEVPRRRLWARWLSRQLHSLRPAATIAQCRS